MLGQTSRAETDSPETRPNIIVIMADDLGYGDLSCYGGIYAVPTPHIDRLAASGIQFTDGYVTAPICGPSRIGFMTGRYQNRIGQDLNDKEEYFIPEDSPTIAKTLKSAG